MLPGVFFGKHLDWYYVECAGVTILLFGVQLSDMHMMVADPGKVSVQTDRQTNGQRVNNALLRHVCMCMHRVYGVCMTDFFLFLSHLPS